MAAAIVCRMRPESTRGGPGAARLAGELGARRGPGERRSDAAIIIEVGHDRSGGVALDDRRMSHARVRPAHSASSGGAAAATGGRPRLEVLEELDLPQPPPGLGERVIGAEAPSGRLRHDDVLASLLHDHRASPDSGTSITVIFTATRRFP